MENNEVFIKLGDVEHAAGFDNHHSFFDVKFVPQLTNIARRWQPDLMVAMVYPETTAYRSNVKIACLTEPEYVALKKEWK